VVKEREDVANRIVNITAAAILALVASGTLGTAFVACRRAAQIADEETDFINYCSQQHDAIDRWFGYSLDELDRALSRSQSKEELRVLREIIDAKRHVLYPTPKMIKGWYP
jgi:hypothetical protein